MAGIAGIRGHRKPGALEAMAAAIAHRGAYIAVLTDGRRCALAQLGAEPMAIEPMDGLLVVADASLYNRKELCEELGRRLPRTRLETDADIVAAAYRFFGDDFVHRLDGDFAVALWDARAGRLLLARDPLGVRPLFYRSAGPVLFFASEFSGLVQDPAFRREIHPGVLLNYLQLSFVPGTRTILRGIREVAPGSVVSADDTSITEGERCLFKPARRVFPVSVRSSAKRIRETMRRAVRRRMPAGGHVGLLLSGGLDSACVAAALRDVHAGPVEAYVVGSAGDAQADGEIARAEVVARHFGMPLRRVTVTPEDFIRQAPDIIWSLGQPYGSSIPMYFLKNAAAAPPDRVFFSGLGADMLFGMNKFVNRTVYTPFRFERAPLWGMYGLEALVRMKRLAFARKDNESARRAAWERSGMFFDDDAAAVLPAARPADEAAGHWRTLFDEMRPAGSRRDWMTWAQRIEMHLWYPGELLLYSDRFAAAAGGMFSAPFIDREMVRLASSIPPGFRYFRGRNKFLLEEAYGPLLPRGDSVRAGFECPYGRWIAGSLRPVVAAVLSRESVAVRGLLNPDAVSRVVARAFAHTPAEPPGEHLAFQVWILFMFELWCRLFLDRSVPDRSRLPAAEELFGVKP